MGKQSKLKKGIGQKYTSKQLLEVERLYYMDYSNKEIANETGVGRETVRRYILEHSLESKREEIKRSAITSSVKKINKSTIEKVDITKAVAKCLDVEVSILNELIANLDKMVINYSSDSMIKNISLLTNDILLQTGFQDLAKTVEKEYHFIFQTILQRLEIAFSKDNYNIIVSIFREELEKIKIDKESTKSND